MTATIYLVRCILSFAGRFVEFGSQKLSTPEGNGSRAGLQVMQFHATTGCLIGVRRFSTQFIYVWIVQCAGKKSSRLL